MIILNEYNSNSEKLALGSSGPISPLKQIITWLESIGLELKHSNECRIKIADPENVKFETVKVNKEVVILWLNIIMTFRNEGLGNKSMYFQYYHLRRFMLRCVKLDTNVLQFG